MRRLWNYFQRFLRYRRQLIAGFACIPLAQLGDVAITVVVGNALDRLRPGSPSEFLAGIFGLILLISAAKGVFRYLQRWWIVAVSRYVENELKAELFAKLVSLPFGFHNQSRSGELVSRVTSDVENVRMFLGPGVMYTLGAVVMVPVSMGLLFSINAPLAATMILPLVLMGLGMKLFTPHIHRYSQLVQESLADIGHRAQENFSGIRVVKGYGREAQQLARFEVASSVNRDNQILLGRSRGWTHALTHAANDSTFVVILVLGGLAMIDRELPAGDLFKFIDLTFKVFWPIIAIGWIAGMYPRAHASAVRIDELLERTSDIRDPARPVVLAQVAGRLTLEDVGFTYPGADRPAVSGVSFDARAGSVVGIVGPTGSGKTTLLLLLGRLYDASTGTIRLDGERVQDLSLAQLRASLGYVPQDSFLFSAPYAENISFGSDVPLSRERIEQLVESVRMTDEVARFEKGLDQMIGERGVTLSGGQRQRTCIARALARDPRILILDDALSAVDTETETRLIENLASAGAGRTVVLAAHRLSSVQRADWIVVLRGDGSVETQGRHAQLIARDGWYKDTWSRQQAQDELSVL